MSSVLNCITNYKKAVRITSVSIIVLQLARISVISHEAPHLTYWYPQTHALVFCVASILLGVLSIFLEGILLWAIKQRKINGIQPWFLTTFVIFLFAGLAFAITASLFVIRPLDHNMNVRNDIRDGRPLTPPENTTKEQEDHENEKNHTLTPEETLTNHIRKALRSFVHHEEKLNLTANNSVILTASLNDMKIFSETIPITYNKTKCSKKELDRMGKFYSVRPSLSLSFLFDVLRSFPQLFLVNRYVKSERLHHMHYHSHASLATLYVKQ